MLPTSQHLVGRHLLLSTLQNCQGGANSDFESAVRGNGSVFHLLSSNDAMPAPTLLGASLSSSGSSVQVPPSHLKIDGSLSLSGLPFLISSPKKTRKGRKRKDRPLSTVLCLPQPPPDSHSFSSLSSLSSFPAVTLPIGPFLWPDRPSGVAAAIPLRPTAQLHRCFHCHLSMAVTVKCATVCRRSRGPAEPASSRFLHRRHTRASSAGTGGANISPVGRKAATQGRLF